jgi:hypothetical protein
MRRGHFLLYAHRRVVDFIFVHSTRIGVKERPVGRVSSVEAAGSMSNAASRRSGSLASKNWCRIMPIQVLCGCGRSLRVKAELAGRRVRCPDCGAVLVVPQASAAKDPEEEALHVLSADSPKRAPQKSPLPATAPKEASAERKKLRSPAPAPQIPRSLPNQTKPKPTAKAKKRSQSDSSDRSGPMIVINPAIVSGTLMMAGAAIWFFVGLAAGIIYFYPPVLFLLGIGAVIRGFTGGE